jgi:hypothetical protein
MAAYMNMKVDIDESEKVEINLNEALRVFLLLEEMVAFLHQPDHYKDISKFGEWLESGGYDSGLLRELQDVVNNVIPKWLPSGFVEESTDQT